MSQEERQAPNRAVAALRGQPAGTPTQETYGDLQRAYDHFNQVLFEARLQACLITLRARNNLGYFYWDRFQHSDGRRSHEIALNPEEFARHTIEQCLSTLVRMQVLQIQRIARTHSRPGYYNRDFADRMGAIGLGVKNTGTWGGTVTGDKVSHFIMPGGPFALAARSLVDRNFRARWADRFLSHGERDWAIIEPPGDVEAFSAPVRAATIAVIDVQVSSEDEAGQGAADRDGEFAVTKDSFRDYGGTAPPPLQTSPRDFISPRPSGDPSKAKFVCPLCKAAAWGKRSLHLVCGDCVVAMRRADWPPEATSPRRGSAFAHLHAIDRPSN